MDRRRARAILKGMEMKYRAMIGIGSDFDEIYAQFVEALEMAGSTEDRWRAPPRLNAYYAGKHHQVRKKDAQELHTIAWAAMKQAKVRKKMVTGPVEVRFCWDDNLDIDNHAVIGKAVVDAMKGYLLPDDNRKWVRKVSHEFWDGGAILVEVRKYEKNTDLYL